MSIVNADRNYIYLFGHKSSLISKAVEVNHLHKYFYAVWFCDKVSLNARIIESQTYTGIRVLMMFGGGVLFGGFFLLFLFCELSQE